MNPSDFDDAVATLTLYEVNQNLLQGKIPSVIPLKCGKTVIGRGSQSDVILNAQRDGKFIISRKHAIIEIYPSANKQYECILGDLGAINGTYVNEVRISRYTIKSGDIIQFGGMCDVPEGYILEHSDVSVKYKFQILPQKPSNGSKSKNKGKLPSPISAAVIGADRDSRVVSDQKTPKLAQKRKSESSNKDDSVKPSPPANLVDLPDQTTSQHSSSDNKNKKAKLAGDAEPQSNLDKLFEAIRHQHQDSSDSSKAPIAVEQEETSKATATVPPPDSEVLEAFKRMNESQKMELQEMREQFSLLMQSLHRTEERLVQATVSAEKKEKEQREQWSKKRDEDKEAERSSLETSISRMTETFLKENDRLKEEILSLRQQLQSALTVSLLPPPPAAPSSSSIITASSEEKQSKAKKEKKKPPEVSTKKNEQQQSFCQIDVSSLAAQLTCTLCQQLLLDAVVLRCSHGFCRLCIEKHIQSEVSTCPICRDPPPVFLPPLASLSKKKKTQEKQKSPKQRNVFSEFIKASEVKRPRDVLYHRSDHLDSLVWMLLQTQCEEERQVSSSPVQSSLV